MSRKIWMTMALLAITSSGVAAYGQPLATADVGAGGVEWRPVRGDVGLVLTITGPEGFYERQAAGPGESLLFSVFDTQGGERPSGAYVYELRAVPHVDGATRAALDSAREAGGDATALRKTGKLPTVLDTQSGAFTVDGGAILMGGEEEARPAGGNRLATKDQVIPDDLIVQGSICAGFDCVNNESFGFDTIRLKENNTRIKFEDTSSTTGFPSSDWQLTANDSASGGLNKFSIEDITSARVPFTIVGGASTNSIFVDSTGRVGFRTSTPVLDLHVSTTNTPAMRLEQTNGGGFTAQTWDVAGNEANFFVRDVTGGSRLPLRIRPGAPTSSIDVSATGNVGMGTASPDSPLHVFENSASFVAPLNLENAGGDVGFRLTNDLSVIDVNLIESGGANELRINLGSSPQEFSLTETGDLTITGSLFTGAGNTCAAGCDRVFSPDFQVPEIEEHAAFMWQNSHLPAVGPTPEQGVVNLSKTTGGILHELEVAHIYIEQLNGELKSKQQKLADIEHANRELEQGQEELQRQMAELREQLARLLQEPAE